MYRYKIKYFVYEIILYYIILKMVVLFCQQCNNCTYTHILYNYRCLYLRFKFCIYVFVLHTRALFTDSIKRIITS